MDDEVHALIGARRIGGWRGGYVRDHDPAAAREVEEVLKSWLSRPERDAADRGWEI